jgi:EAL domain-containing protein (putative c-di-GMP-specific phosphodiesterase class I)
MLISGAYSDTPSHLQAVTNEVSSKSMDTGWVLVRQAVDHGTVQRVAITSPSFQIGRQPSNHLAIADRTVSGRHAELLQIDTDLFLRDLNSTNGTLLNGRRVQNLTGLQHGDVIHFGSVMFTLVQGGEDSITATVTADSSSDAMGQLQFDKLLKRPALRPYFQPIVRLEDHSRIGFEMLSRSHLIGLETPDKMFRVAAQRTSEAELSIACRLEGLRCGAGLGNEMKLYLNTHPVELRSIRLFDSLNLMRAEYPDASIVLEVHEAAVVSAGYLRDLRKVLNDLKIGLAYDDFGAGQARLKELFDVPPDVLKFDSVLINDLPYASAAQRSTIQSLVRLVRDLKVLPLAEGVETAEEAACCFELGFELAQGYLFGRPEPVAYWSVN